MFFFADLRAISCGFSLCDVFSHLTWLGNPCWVLILILKVQCLFDWYISLFALAYKIFTTNLATLLLLFFFFFFIFFFVILPNITFKCTWSILLFFSHVLARMMDSFITCCPFFPIFMKLFAVLLTNKICHVTKSTQILCPVVTTWFSESCYNAKLMSWCLEFVVFLRFLLLIAIVTTFHINHWQVRIYVIISSKSNLWYLEVICFNSCRISVKITWLRVLFLFPCPSLL